jgi:hypothetical protein
MDMDFQEASNELKKINVSVGIIHAKFSRAFAQDAHFSRKDFNETLAELDDLAQGLAKLASSVKEHSENFVIE